LQLGSKFHGPWKTVAFKLLANHRPWMILKVTDNQYGRLF